MVIANTEPTHTASAEPIVPDYLGANVRGIVPALLGPSGWQQLPSWMPPELAECRQVALLVLDGLGWDQLQERTHLAPTLAGMTAKRLTTVAPSTTATALASICTGLTPGEHGLIGYRIVLGGEVVNVLRWTAEGNDRRRSQPPGEVQRVPGFMGQPVPVVTPLELAGTAFSSAHMAGSHTVPVRANSSIAIETGRLLREGERFVYVYYGLVDKIAHERGFGPYYDAELRAADRLVGDLIEQLPAGTGLLVTADHGQVDVGDNIVHPSADLLSMVAQQSGEGRFRWLHARRGAVPELLAAATSEFGGTGWVRGRQQLLDEGWFGPVVPAPVAARLGDVAVVAREDVSYFDPADTGPFELVCRHGSLTSAEVYVPLLFASAR
jgi:hypothetical protein